MIGVLETQSPQSLFARFLNCLSALHAIISKGLALIRLFGLLEPSLAQGCLHTPDGAIVEAPFALFDEEGEVLTRDAVVTPQAAMVEPVDPF
jgi:hypothetical protein